jgi:hypothetical protein
MTASRTTRTISRWSGSRAVRYEGPETASEREKAALRLSLALRAVRVNAPLLKSTGRVNVPVANKSGAKNCAKFLLGSVMRHKNRRYELPEEVIVLECSPNFEPCKGIPTCRHLCFREASE